MFDDDELNSLRDKVKADEERIKKETEFKELLKKDKELNPTKTQKLMRWLKKTSQKIKENNAKSNNRWTKK